MSDPINPNTLIPMSLEVERIAEIRKVQDSNNQNMLSQMQENTDKKKNKTVKQKDKSENRTINKDGEHSNPRQGQERENQDKKDDTNETSAKSKGHFVDIKI